jgi:hypothetical protein
LPGASVEHTGQTTVYATGDDGDWRAGTEWVESPSLRFTDNGDGTVTGNLTGLIWLKNADCFGYEKWFNALSECTALKHGSCGLIDGSSAGEWRLPNVKELQSLVDYGQVNPALPSGHPFINVQYFDYWSGTTLAYATPHAWLVSMYNGLVSSNPKSNVYCVWPVRGGTVRG